MQKGLGNVGEMEAEVSRWVDGFLISRASKPVSGVKTQGFE
jgi:hypothetical protein